MDDSCLKSDLSPIRDIPLPWDVLIFGLLNSGMLTLLDLLHTFAAWKGPIRAPDGWLQYRKTAGQAVWALSPSGTTIVLSPATRRRRIISSDDTMSQHQLLWYFARGSTFYLILIYTPCFWLTQSTMGQSSSQKNQFIFPTIAPPQFPDSHLGWALCLYPPPGQVGWAQHLLMSFSFSSAPLRLW